MATTKKWLVHLQNDARAYRRVLVGTLDEARKLIEDALRDGAALWGRIEEQIHPVGATEVDGAADDADLGRTEEQVPPAGGTRRTSTGKPDPTQRE